MSVNIPVWSIQTTQTLCTTGFMIIGILILGLSLSAAWALAALFKGASQSLWVALMIYREGDSVKAYSRSKLIALIEAFLQENPGHYKHFEKSIRNAAKRSQDG